MIDWGTAAAIGALIVSGIVMFTRMFDKSLTIREHDEYRKGAERVADGLEEQFRREIDKLDQRLTIIDQSKPSVGELQAAIVSVKEQLQELKILVHKITNVVKS